MSITEHEAERSAAKEQRVQRVKTGFKRATAWMLLGAAFAEMLSVAFVKRKDSR